MKKLFTWAAAIFFVAGIQAPSASLASPDVDWTVTKQLTLDAVPLDVSTSADGRWVFILTQGEVLVYSVADGKIFDRIPVDRSLDKLSYLVRGNSLVLTSHSGKSLEILQMEFVRQIDVSGNPFRGNAQAPVTIAVFSDYQ